MKIDWEKILIVTPSHRCSEQHVNILKEYHSQLEECFSRPDHIHEELEGGNTSEPVYVVKKPLCDCNERKVLEKYQALWKNNNYWWKAPDRTAFSLSTRQGPMQIDDCPCCDNPLP